MGIPYDEKSSFQKGASQGAHLIMQTIKSEANNSFSENGSNTFDHFEDLGQCSISDYWDIEKAVLAGLNTHPKLLILGGDHSVTYPTIRAYRKKEHQFDILHFDAHSDLYDSFMGDPYSHACPFARIMEEGLTRRLVQVGIRTQTDHLRDQVQRYGVEVIEMKDFDRNTVILFNNPVYISIDMDGFDPAFAPGVVHQEAGGLSSRDVIHMIQTLEVPVIGADIVEFNPIHDVSNTTAVLCAKLVKELVSKMSYQ